jgi:hypothetical protein
LANPHRRCERRYRRGIVEIPRLERPARYVVVALVALFVVSACSVISAEPLAVVPTASTASTDLP